MNRQELIKSADDFIIRFYKECGRTEQQMNERRVDVKNSIEKHGYYEHTFEELQYGAKVAWRNSNHCIGRLFWDQLNVIDARGARTSGDVFQYLFQHIETATNGGKIKPLITVFQPEINGHLKVKVWNHQLLRYAGYSTDDGVIGDPDSVSFTNKCLQLGWKGEGTPFDLLPLVVQIDDHPPQYMDIPKEIVIEIPIDHPNRSIFGDIKVKWYAVPIISDMRLEIGGINYVAAPFNGWYMGTEIGARNLADSTRYNLLPVVAKQIGLDRKHNRSLWKDQALVELNIAVLDSFKRHGVTIVDHHTAAEQFRVFEQQEFKAERGVTGKWSWLIPPVSPATTHIFHKPFDNTVHTPNYFYQEKFYE
ncbi:MAG TPA: nitric oxide synthase oxygenase [Bacillota bacterium]|nr:nitric oxide synthase oxygenase [Bacillota bacterium]